METKFIRALVVLGVPGVALGIFYLLLRTFSFEFSQIDQSTTGVVAIIFLLLVGSLTAYALHLWRPAREKVSERQVDDSVIRLDFGEERVFLKTLMRSIGHDVIKVEAHTHQLGVAAEYAWKERNYPESALITQSLQSLKTRKSGDKEIYFDVLKIRLKDGRSKEIYYDISSFFSAGHSSAIDPQSFIASKIQEIYS